MPKVTPNPSEYLGIVLQNFHRQIQGIAQRQSVTHVDSSMTATNPSSGATTVGPPVMHVGQIPTGSIANPRWQSPARPLYGIQVNNRTTGNPATHYGSQPDGTHGMWSLDGSSAANPVLKVGEILDGSSTYYGLGLFNSSQDLIGLLGQLPGGDYGMAIYDAAGHLVGQLGELPDGNYGLGFYDGGTEVLELNSSGLIVANSSGNTILNIGQVGGAPALSLYTASGNLVAQLGYLPDGNYALGFYNSAGVEQLELNSSGLVVSNSSGSTVLQVGKIAGLPAMVSYDSTGKERARIGQLASGDYGFSVQDTQSTPVVTEILPLYHANQPNTLSTSSTTPVTLATAPTFTAVIGASGDAMVTTSSFIGLPAYSETGFVFLVVDGVTSSEPFLGVSSSSGGNIAVSSSNARPLSGSSIGTVTPGVHTFALQFSAANGHTVNFSATGLNVQPI